MSYKDPATRKAYDKAYEASHPRARLGTLERREYMKAYGTAHPDQRHRDHGADYYASHPEQSKKDQLRKYGLTPETFAAMLLSQDGRCAICGTDKWPGKGPHVDHDHVTGKTRGILCHSCNIGIGSLGDSPEILREAVAYLETRC